MTPLRQRCAFSASKQFIGLHQPRPLCPYLQNTLFILFFKALEEVSCKERRVLKPRLSCDLYLNQLTVYYYLQYKYQLNIDGTVAAYRFPYLMVANSLVFKQDSTYYEHFYRHLEPWKHYIPLKSDLSDVIEKLKWAKDHDSEVVLNMSMYVCMHSKYQCL